MKISFQGYSNIKLDHSTPFVISTSTEKDQQQKSLGSKIKKKEQISTEKDKCLLNSLLFLGSFWSIPYDVEGLSFV